MAIIDGHLHVLSWDWIPEGMRTAWARQAAGRSTPERDPASIFGRVSKGQSDPDGSLTIAAFDRCGIERGVIPIVDWTIVGRPVGEALSIRDMHAQHVRLVEAHPDRLPWCAGVEPRHPDAQAIAEEALASPGCVGFKIYPSAGWVADDPAHDWVYRLAVARGVPVVVHTAPLGGDPLVTPNSRPAAMAPVLQRHPDMKMVFAHAGFEAWWLEAADIASGYWRCHLDVSLWQRVAFRDYAEFRKRMAIVVERVGAHHVIWGSDHIRGHGADPAGDELAQWIDRFQALAEPFGGEPPVLSAEEVELAMSRAARLCFALPGA